MVTRFDKNMYHNYMIIEDLYEAFDKFQEEMLSNNQIEGLLPLEIRYYNDERRYYYNITGLHEIRTIFEKKSLDKIQLESIAKQIIYHIINIHNYLLDENDIILLPEQVFLHSRTNEIRLCYCPGYNKDIMHQMELLFEYLMKKVEYNDKEAVILIYSLYMRSKDENGKINELLNIIEDKDEKRLNLKNIEITNHKIIKDQYIQHINANHEFCNAPILEKNDTKAYKNVMNQSYTVDEEQTEVEIEALTHPIKKYIVSIISLITTFILIYLVYHSGVIHQTFGLNINRTKAGIFILFLVLSNSAVIYIQISKNKKLSKACASSTCDMQNNNTFNDGKYSQKLDSINSSEEDTVILKDNRDICLLKLIPEDKLNYQVITFTEFPYYIGKLKYNTSSCILSPTISKIHAKITKEDEEYVIYDLNSTNGTFVNEIRLPVNGATNIVNNDKITFANVTYTFKCETTNNQE